MISEGTPLPIANDKSTGSMQEHLLGALQRVLPREVRIATAYLTPDGFMSLRSGFEGAKVAGDRATSPQWGRQP